MDVQRFARMAVRIRGIMDKKVTRKEIRTYCLTINTDDRVLLFETVDNKGQKHSWNLKLESQMKEIEKQYA